MSFTSSKQFCIPLEILHEFILQSSSSPTSLAAWCSVSRSLLSIAAPLLYRTVVLKRSKDVTPFLENLLLARSSSPPPSSSLVLPSLKGIERLEIIALPPQDDARHLFQETANPPLPSKDFVLAINWEAQTNMATFWIPSLLQLVRPHRYEELGTLRPFSLSGLLLDVYLRTTRLDVSDQVLEILYTGVSETVYCLRCSLDLVRSHEDEEDYSSTPSPLLTSLALKLKGQRSWVFETSLLEKAPDGNMDWDDVVDYFEINKVKMIEYQQTLAAEVAEFQRLLAVSVAELEDLDEGSDASDDLLDSHLVTNTS